jgi:hypothetical protein
MEPSSIPHCTARRASRFFSLWLLQKDAASPSPRHRRARGDGAKRRRVLREWGRWDDEGARDERRWVGLRGGGADGMRTRAAQRHGAGCSARGMGNGRKGGSLRWFLSEQMRDVRVIQSDRTAKNRVLNQQTSIQALFSNTPGRPTH